MTDYRKAYGLPERYFLSLGRMVEKKNLATLIAAYGRYCDESRGFARQPLGNRVASGGSWPVGVAAPPQAEETGDRGQGEKKHGAGSMEQRANLTENCKLNTEHCPPGLVFVGSGELENALREQARGLGLRIVDRTDWKAGQSSHSRACETAEGKLTRINTDKSERLAADRTEGNAASPVTRAGCEGPQSQAEPRLCETGLSQNCKPNTEHSVENHGGAVFFYGFRQIEENAVFYALAEAFVLPSLKEEWGLVVNEAMAAGLPVIVSRTAGCAEDLLPASGQVTSGEWQVASGRQEADARAARPSLELRSNGFAFDPTSSDALSEALRCVAESEDRRLEMGKRSWEIVDKFSCENFAKQAMRAAEAASA